MQKKDIFTILLLIILTVITSLISGFYNKLEIISISILSLSGIKFLAVAFQFMELKKANPFWKFLIPTFLIIFIGTISILL